MKMNEKAICCEKCLKVVAKRNVASSRLWLDLCDLDKKYGIFGIKSCENPHLRILELFRLIMTTESDKTIFIKVSGKKSDAEGDFYCGDLHAD